MTKVVCVVFPGAKAGHPSSCPRDSIATISQYSIDWIAPTPQTTDFKPGTMLGDVSGEPRPRHYLEVAHHRLVVISDKDEPNSAFDHEPIDADVVVSQPFWPAYLTSERIENTKNLKLAVTAGVGSDHVDLVATNECMVTASEVTFSNSISVAEHVVVMIWRLVRGYIAQHEFAKSGGWGIAYSASRPYDVEDM
jgi:formate dehydrogenase